MPTELHSAALAGNIAAVHALISQGANVNERDIGGWTPLMSAAREGHAEIVQILLDAKAEVNLQANNGGTALTDASLQGHLDIVKLLLNEGADVRLKLVNGIDALMEAASGGHTPIVKLLLAESININERDALGRTALMEACIDGHLETVKFLLENGADPNTKSKDGYTALHIAALNNRDNLIAYLVNNGADINSKNDGGATPLLLAALRGHRQTVDTLLAFRADVNIPASNGTTPLMAAASNFHFDAVERLVSGGANVDAVAADGYTVFGALQEAHERMVELIKPSEQLRTLYRIISFDRLEDLILRKMICMTQIKSWDDTYEGFHVREIIRSTLKDNFPNIADRMLDALIEHEHQCMYAQCWTTLEESDGLWRIYSPDKKGIRISVNREKLLTHLSKHIPGLAQGRVTYCSSKEVVSRIAHIFREELQKGVPIRKLLENAFLYKRLEFSHEHEFRIGAILNPPGFALDIPPDDSNTHLVDSAIATIKACSYQTRICLQFDPSLIEEVILDPRASDLFLAQVQSLCDSAPEIRHIIVRKSELYGQPS
jgi:ankyrin repeat protein